MSEKQNVKRDASYDLLRVISAFAVVIIHTCAQEWRKIDVQSTEWLIITVWDMLSKYSVPIFFMVSGRFLLDGAHESDIKTTLTKRFPKIAAAFLFWSAIYTVVNIVRTDDIKSNIKWIIIEFFTGEYHMWFLFALACLYIATPLLKAIANDEKLCKYYLILFFLFQLVFPAVGNIPKIGVFVVTALEKAQFKFVMGFSGYYVLGYYLGKHLPKRKFKIFIYAAGVIGTAYSVFSVVSASRSGGAADETSAQYLTWNVALSSIAVYTAVLSAALKKPMKERAENIISFLAGYSFGVYLAHPLFLWIFEWLGITPTAFSPLLSVPLIAAFAAALSFLLVWALRKIPKIGKMIT